METDSLSADPLNFRMPDRAVSRILEHLDAASLLRCRLVSRHWRDRVDSCGPWVRMLRRLGLFDFSRCGEMTSQRARQLLMFSGLKFSDLPLVSSGDVDDLANRVDNLHLLPRCGTVCQEPFVVDSHLLDAGRCCLVKREQLRIDRIRDAVKECDLNFCTTSWFCLAGVTLDGLCAAIPLKPVGAYGRSSLQATALLDLPRTAFNRIMASAECASCGDNQLLIVSILGDLQLWNSPEVDDSRSPDSPLPYVDLPADYLNIDLRGDEECLMIMRVGSPAGADYSSFVVIISNDSDTRSTVVFVRADCCSLEVIRGRIPLGGDERSFVTAKDDAFVSMVIAKDRQSRERWVRINRFVVTGPKKVQSHKFMYSIPNGYADASVSSSSRLVGYGSRLFCVSFRSDTVIALYRPSYTQPLCMVRLPWSVDCLFPVSDWLDNGFNAAEQRESCPLLASVNAEDNMYRLISWSWPTGTDGSAAENAESSSRVKFTSRSLV